MVSEAPAQTRLDERTQFAVLLFTDICDSTALKAQHGALQYKKAAELHNRLFEKLAGEEDITLIKNMGDGYFARSTSVAAVVRFALRFQHGMRSMEWPGCPIATRVGIHAGEVADITTLGQTDVLAPAADLVARVMGLAVGGQILLTRGPFDEARHFVREHPDAVEGLSLAWLAHGPYFFKGCEEPVEVFEVGLSCYAPLIAPSDGEKAKRAIRPGEEETLGWRPACGLEAPGRVGWLLVRKIGEGGFGEVWLAEQTTSKQKRVFKFCFDEERLRSFKRELTFFRLIRDALGERADITRLYDVKLDEPPFFLESEYAELGNLTEWCENQGGAGTVPMERRIDLMAQIAEAVAAAHSVGILHKDLKPQNVLMKQRPGGGNGPQITDFGIGALADKATLAEMGITAAGFTVNTIVSKGSSNSMTRLHAAPEQLAGKTFTMQGDVYALGVILYQFIIGDFTRALAPGWEREVADELLREDLAKCLDGDPAYRLASANELAQRLRTLDERRAAREAERRSAASSARRKRYLRLAMAGGAAAAVIAAVLGVGFLRERELRSAATASEQKASVAESIARTEAHRATKAEAVAVQEKETARQALAKSQIDLAEKEFERGKFDESQKILDETPEGFRDANWRFLRAHSRDFTRQICVFGKRDVSLLQFMPHGDRFATRCFSNAIGIFALTGRQIGDWIPVNGSHTRTFGIDRTGSRIAFPTWKNHVAVRNVADGTSVGYWPCDLGDNKVVLLSPDGETVLVAGKDQLIAYAVQKGTPLWTQPYLGVVPAFSPDGRSVAILGAKSELALKIQLLDTANGAVRSTLEATADNPDKATLQYNQAGDRLACLGGDEVILWNPQTNAKIRALHLPGEKVMLLSPGGDTVASFRGGRIRLWDTTTGQLLRSLNGVTPEVRALAFSPDGTMLLSAFGTCVNVWPTRLGEEIASARSGTYLGYRVIFNPDNTGFYAFSGGGASRWNIENGLKGWEFSGWPRIFHDLAIHPVDGSILLSQDSKHGITHISSDGEVLEAFGTCVNSEFKFNLNGQLLLALEPANAHLLSAKNSLEFSVMEYPSGKVLRKVSCGSRSFAAFCLDDTAVATATINGGISVWDWKEGTRLREIAAAQTGRIGCLASSPDGRHLASGGPDRWIRVWEAATGRLETAFRAHWESVGCVKFSPDGREILSGSADGTVRINDAATGEEKLAFYGLTTPVVDVDISADGTLIAAITYDGFTKVWDRNISSDAALLPAQPSAK